MREKDMNNPNVNYMVCELCNEKLHPLDAHFGRLKGKLTSAHIDCWNKVVQEETETYTTEQASLQAIQWCKKHKGWKRICDIEDSDSLYKTWVELSEKEQKPWVEEYRSGAEECWNEFGMKPCKGKKGFVTGKGEFYKNVLEVPHLHNLMMVFKVS